MKRIAGFELSAARAPRGVPRMVDRRLEQLDTEHLRRASSSARAR
jgi:hypothetical protein